MPVPRPVPVPVPVNPYFYHPFVPYSWGPYWHPVGVVVGAIATTAIIVTVADHAYHYDHGEYYVQTDGGYKVVPAPVGAVVNTLPAEATKVVAGGVKYYYYSGAFYMKQAANSYIVVTPPVGAVVDKLPEGAETRQVDGKAYVYYEGTYYQPISGNSYEVVHIN